MSGLLYSRFCGNSELVLEGRTTTTYNCRTRLLDMMGLGRINEEEAEGVAPVIGKFQHRLHVLRNSQDC